LFADAESGAIRIGDDVFCFTINLLSLLTALSVLLAHHHLCPTLMLLSTAAESTKTLNGHLLTLTSHILHSTPLCVLHQHPVTACGGVQQVARLSLLSS
jgi:hypothetical protein